MRRNDVILVICNHARDSCAFCVHNTPHDKNDDLCTKWGSCFEFPDGQATAVRCIKVKGGINEQ